MTDFYHAQQKLRESNQDMWLGAQVLYSVEESKIKHTDLVRILVLPIPPLNRPLPRPLMNKGKVRSRDGGGGGSSSSSR